jgi:uncharacterized protein
MTLDEIKAELRKQQPVLRERFKGTVIGVFGSRARGDHRPDSDLDLLVDFDQGADYFDVLHMEEYLIELLGIRVEICAADGLTERGDERVNKDLVRV